MFILPLQLLAAVFLAISSIIWYSLPAHMHGGQDDAVSLRIARSTFKVSQEAIDQLTNIQDESTGLLPLWKRAKNLTNEAWLTAEVKSYCACVYISRGLFLVSTIGTQGV